jgi:amino acid transporter
MSEPVPSAPVTGGQPQASFEAADRHLRKEMSFQQLLFMPLSGIIGSGWLFAALAAAAIVGPAAIISWVVGGILIIFVALTYAELPAMLPRSGAPTSPAAAA